MVTITNLSKIKKSVETHLKSGDLELIVLPRAEYEALLEKLEKDKLITEDDKFRGIDEVQKLVDKYTARVDDILKSKEKEITEF